MREPRAYERFRCIGPECEDTCCDGWGILVDEATYGKYQNPALPEVAGKVLSTLVEINPARTSSGDFARIKLEGTRCPALLDGLCAIQKTLGEPYIADLCSMFPRVVSITGGVLERSLHLSCPEAARLVLLDPDAMRFEEREGDGQPYRAGSVVLLANDVPDDSVHRVRSLMMEVIRERSRPLWQRIVSLGCAIDRIADMEIERAAGVMEDHLRCLRTGALDELLLSQKGNPALQLETALELIVARLGADYTSPRFIECYREFMLGLEWNAKSSMEELAERYQGALRTWFLPFVREHEHVLENYLINYMFRTLFPYRKKRPDQRFAIDSSRESMKNAYLLLATHYAIIRALLIGLAARHREQFGPGQAVKLVQSYSKAFLHSGTFEKTASEFLDRNGEELTRKIAVLVMD
ncbi:MAG TPA: flagellin lysine-N-methylase [Bryobacteraceae bacterium]|nr:flagellin lysine-N-methylase [Bryobacteraceae bacterium]